MGGELGYELRHILANHARIYLGVMPRYLGTQLIQSGELGRQQLPDPSAYLVEPEINLVFG